MTQAFDVCIRGAGIVGRTLALLLARERLKVALVEQPANAATIPESAAPANAEAKRPADLSPSGHGDVRAYALNAASQALLTSLDAWPDERDCTAVTGMRVFGDGGGAVSFDAPPRARAPGARRRPPFVSQPHPEPHETNAGDAANEDSPQSQRTDPPRGNALAYIVDVPALQTLLADAVRDQSAIESMTEPPAYAALTVICEGRASASRGGLAVPYDVTPYGQHAIATRVSCEQPHGGIARQWFDGGRILALLPLGGADGDTAAVVWSVADADAPQLMALAPDEFAAQLEAASHGALGQLQLTHERASWPLQLAQARRWTGRFDDDTLKKPRAWALAGDAAHTVHPLAGQGLNLGLADAAELAKVLHERDYWRGVADEKVLRRYERSRKAGVVAMRTATDGLQRLFAQEGERAQWLRNWGMRGFDRSGPIKAWAVRQAMGL